MKKIRKNGRRKKTASVQLNRRNLLYIMGFSLSLLLILPLRTQFGRSGAVKGSSIFDTAVSYVTSLSFCDSAGCNR